MAYRLLLICVMLALVCALPLVADTPANYLPEIHSVTITPLVLPGDKVHVVVNATDGTWPVQGVTADGVELWTELYPGPDPWETDPFTWSGDLDADPEPGPHTVSVVARDHDGNTASSTAAYRTTTARGANCSFLLTPVAELLSTQYQFKVWGKVRLADLGSFEVSDGSPYPVLAECRFPFPEDGDIVEARGVLDVAGTRPVLRYPTLSLLADRPDDWMHIPDVVLGKDMQLSWWAGLPAPVPQGETVDITITSDDPSKVLLSVDGSTAGAASIVVTADSSHHGVDFYIQALASSGCVDLRASSSNGLRRLFKANLRPSGFVFRLSQQTTDRYGANTFLVMDFVILDPITHSAGEEPHQLRPGIPVVPITLGNSNPEVGTTANPVIFSQDDQYAKSTFIPLALGTTTFSLNTPAGYSTPAERQSMIIDVIQPKISAQGSLGAAVGQASKETLQLSSVPPWPISIAIEIADESVATVSALSGQEGTKSIVLTGVTNSWPTFYVHGISAGQTTCTLSSDGYTTRTEAVEVCISSSAKSANWHENACMDPLRAPLYCSTNL